MQSKLCLVLALVVLVGALAVGNPFLSHGSVVVSDGLLQPFSEGGSGIALGVAEGTQSSAPAAALPVSAQRFAPDGNVPVGNQQVSLRAEAPIPGGVIPAGVMTARCPDEHLQELVVRVRHDHAGMPVWELRDGRFVRANPRHGDGEPLVVSVDAGALDADRSFDSAR